MNAAEEIMSRYLAELAKINSKKKKEKEFLDTEIEMLKVLHNAARNIGLFHEDKKLQMILAKVISRYDKYFDCYELNIINTYLMHRICEYVEKNKKFVVFSKKLLNEFKIHINDHKNIMMKCLYDVVEEDMLFLKSNAIDIDDLN